MNETLTVIKERKSVRNYSSDPISTDDLKQITEAAIWAPNAMNKQGWHFTVVTCPDMIVKMSEACRKGLANSPVPFLQERAKDANFHAFFHAPAVIVISIVEDKFTTFDAGSASATLCLAAKSLGYGTCITASTEFMFMGDPSLAKELMPEGYKFSCAITIGKEVDGPDDHVRERKTDVISYI